MFGTVSIFAGGGAKLSSVPIGNQFQLLLSGFVSPVVAPGPRATLPTAPGLADNGPAGAPIFAEIPVAVADQAVGASSRPARRAAPSCFQVHPAGPVARTRRRLGAAPGPSAGATGHTLQAPQPAGLDAHRDRDGTRPATAAGSVGAASGSSDPQRQTRRAPSAPPVRPVASRAEPITQPGLAAVVPANTTASFRSEEPVVPAGQIPRRSHDGEGEGSLSRRSSAAVLVVGMPNALRGQTADPILRVETGMHTTLIRRVVVDAARNRLITASDDKTIRVWQMPEARLVNVLRVPIDSGHEGQLFGLAVSPDGQTVAAGGWTGWDWKAKDRSICSTSPAATW